MPSRTVKTIQQYDKIAPQYARNISELFSEEDIENFGALVKPGGKSLDVGCAAGRDSRILRDKGFDVIGIDLSEKLLEIARKENPNIQFQKADFRKIPFGDRVFDGLWVSAVFHHLNKDEMLPTLAEFKRVLKPNGILYIRTKKGKGILKIKEDLALQEEREFTLLSESDLENMTKASGFEIVKLYTRKDKKRDLYWVVLFCRKRS